MCGIFGVLDHQGDQIPSQQRLLHSAHLLKHRGPDGSGVFRARGVGLAHTRLSLLDPDPRSGQPFSDGDDRHVLVYNGEIYNFRQLKQELQRTGTRFHTTSDTEVLLAAIRVWGVRATIHRLEGMFAFAYYDTRTETLVLARDPLGIKPLYVYDQPDRFLFSSEVRPLRIWLDLRPDLLSISSYLQGHSGPAAGPTFFEGVTSLPPGTLVTVNRGGRARYDEYFSASELPNRELHEQLAEMSDEQLVDRVEEAIRESVASQLIADAPVGALCSGGVDSSLVLALAAKIRPDFTVFHANVVGRTSEYQAALALAKHLGLTLRVVDVEDQHFIQTLPEVMAHYEQPFTFHPESIAYLMVCRLVNRHQHKAVLSGEGADELFVGYSQSVPKLSQLLWRKYFGRDWPKVGWRKWLKRRAFGSPRVYRLSFADRDLVCGLHNRFERDLEMDRIESTCSARLGRHLYEREWSTLHQLAYGLRTLMHRNDSLGMAASVEARFPFLDTRLVRLAVNLPYRCKVRPVASLRDSAHRFVQDKWILRQVADRYLPRALSRRKKIGFPTSAFQRLQIPPRIFENSFVPDLFGLTSTNLRYLTARASPRLKLRLLHLDVWGNVCLRDMATDEMAHRLRSQLRVAA